MQQEGPNQDVVQCTALDLSYRIKRDGDTIPIVSPLVKPR